MKKLIILMTVLFAATLVKADDMMLHVWFSNGSVMSIKLFEGPKTTYKDGNLVITMLKNSVTYPLEKVRRFTYGYSSVGIDTPEKMEAAFSSDGETLTFTGLKPHTQVSLYNVAGVLLQTIDSGNQNKTVISASHLPVGVYVVKVDGGTYKIMKR